MGNMFDRFPWVREKKRRQELQARQQEEIEYRQKTASITRSIAKMEKDEARLKAEAIQLEGMGHHNEAMSKAVLAKRMKQAAAAARQNLVKIQAAHDVAALGTMVNSTVETLTDLSKTIAETADPQKMLELQAENEAASMSMEDLTSQLTDAMGNFSERADLNMINVEGEAALADILGLTAEPVSTIHEAPVSEVAPVIPPVAAASPEVKTSRQRDEELEEFHRLLDADGNE